MNIFNRKKKKRKGELLDSFGRTKSDSFEFPLIERYFDQKEKIANFQVISDRTCNDLDFEELFTFIDRTNSKIGQQYLYNVLRTINYKPDITDKHEEIIDFFTTNPEFRVSVQEQLDKHNKDGAYYITSLFQNEQIKPPGWFFVVRMLSFASLLSLILIFFNTTFILVSVGLFIANLWFHYWNKRQMFQYSGSIPQLLKLIASAKNLYKHDILKSINPKLPQSIKVLDRLRLGMSLFRLESKLQGELEAIIWSVFEFVKMMFLLEPIMFFGMLKQLENKKQEIEEVFVFVGQVDVLISVASLRYGLDSYCKPVINKNATKISGEYIYHPLITNCIKNTIDTKNKSILLTGSNMSGKTTFIRTIGINALVGHTLNTCFAAHFSMPLVKIFSAIRISDDLLNDRSYYFDEVFTIKEMINESKSDTTCLFLLDEIFKGTNTIERISAGKAVLSYIAKSNNIVFVSTHDIELAELLKNEYLLFHFSEKVDDVNIDFDFKLKDGKLKTRNAIKILQVNQYPDDIIQEAIKLSKEMDA